MHEEERLPFAFDGTEHIADKDDMIRTKWACLHLHVGFLGGPAPLAIVAADTCADEVLPAFAAAAGFRDDVIDRQWRGSSSAVDAPMVIAPKDVLAGELHLFIGDVDIEC